MQRWLLWTKLVLDLEQESSREERHSTRVAVLSPPFSAEGKHKQRPLVI